MTEDQTETPIEAQRRREAAERQRVAEVIRRDQIERGLEAARAALMRSDEDELAKRPNETWAQFKARVEQHSFRRRIGTGFLITPETEAHGDYQDATVIHIETDTATQTKRNRLSSPIHDMYERGGIDDEQRRSAEEIEAIISIIRGDVGMRAAFLGMRVDKSRGFIDPSLEAFAVVRAERAYSAWRDLLPMPRQMIIDMLTMPQSLVATARSYRMGWRLGRRRLVDALDRWPTVKDRVWGDLTDEAILASQGKIS